MFLKEFRKILEKIPNDGESWTIVDVFGGSGLLANNAKACKPKATVIYNDFDGYTKRLAHIDDINRLRTILFGLTKDVPRQKRIPDGLKGRILQVIADFDGYIDTRSVSTWLLFSGKQIAHIDELADNQMYNTVRTNDYDRADGYLNGILVTNESFEILIPKYADRPNTMLLLDPPYICTEQKAYAMTGYFGMTKFLRLMKLVRPPYLLFSSTRSELLDYMDYLKDCEPVMWERIGGFEKVSVQSYVNYTSEYEDNMIFKF
ncbi:hypothetical protein MOMA_09301 [Moraxella macacae 0408225]|uniref:D12 class N6 adenine-specific DNA methyltransferase n=2 Tax=Moraxella macacae TaxID=765840 RepID=L2F6P0_9GAMM|nr:hypothetical protein [Moraxella macacae]ELA08744.1 hypothetical protein MOMA_09301 [Moraxella macacae 0408225]